MIWINPRKRRPLKVFEHALRVYVRNHNGRCSHRRLQVLHLLHRQSFPLSINAILKRMSDVQPVIGYATLLRHVRFFERLGWLHVSKKRYLLNNDACIDRYCDNGMTESEKNMSNHKRAVPSATGEGSA